VTGSKRLSGLANAAETVGAMRVAHCFNKLIWAKR